jgi:hypothetical protein
MKELIEQYRHVTHQATILVQVTEHSTITPDTRLGDALHTINSKADLLAHDIISELQQELDDAAKQPNELQPEHKPLWAVIAAGEPDYEARSRGIMGSTKYRLFFTKEDAQELIGDSIDKKVVPVWGE